MFSASLRMTNHCQRACVVCVFFGTHFTDLMDVEDLAYRVHNFTIIRRFFISEGIRLLCLMLVDDRWLVAVRVDSNLLKDLAPNFYCHLRGCTDVD